MRIRAIAVALPALLVAFSAAAAPKQRVKPVADAVLKKECGSCHMAYSPEFLPKRSWEKIVANLSEHFGENATLDDAKRKAVLDRLLATAADTPKAGREAKRFLSSIPSGQTPLRITEVPRWIEEHREVRPEKWKAPAVKTKANCPACHKGAEQGRF